MHCICCSVYCFNKLLYVLVSIFVHLARERETVVLIISFFIKTMFSFGDE